MNDVFNGLEDVLGVPGWVGGMIIMLVTVILVFAIFNIEGPPGRKSHRDQIGTTTSTALGIPSLGYGSYIVLGRQV